MTIPPGESNPFDDIDLFGDQDPVHLYELPEFGIGDMIEHGRGVPTRTEAIAAAISRAASTGATVQFSFNGTPIRVAADTDPNLIERDIERPSIHREVALYRAIIGPHPDVILSEDGILEDMRIIQSAEAASEDFRQKVIGRKALMGLLASLPDLEITSEPSLGIETWADNADFRIAYTTGLDWATLVQYYVDTEAMVSPDAAARAMQEVDTTAVFDGSSPYRSGFFPFGFSGWKYEDDAREWLDSWNRPVETDIADIAHLDPDGEDFEF
jgi:hypothetical protein